MVTIIVKHRTEPLIIEGLRAAISRMNPNDEKVTALRNAYASRLAGINGEKRVDRVFNTYSFPMKHKIFNGISLTSSTHFQIDTLFITPAYAIVFEIKNIAGTLKVKTNPPQLVQILDNGETKGFVSPISQIESNKELLQDWFHSRSISLPIYTAVVLAYPKKDVDLEDKVTPFLYPTSIPTFIRKLPTTPHLLDQKSFSRVINNLKKSDRIYIPQPICSTYFIVKEEISTGVSCPSCSVLGMEKYRGGWYCLACSHKSADAHVQAIRDWLLLFGGKMTNADCRSFLHIDKHQTATRILKSMNLQTEGANRNRTYSMHANFERRL